MMTRFGHGPKIARFALLVGTAFLPCAFVACSNSGGAAPAAADGGFHSAVFQTFMTDAKDLRIELRTAPFQPPQVGEGRYQLSITDAATGDPVDGLIIKVEPYMPDMHHPGSALTPVVEPQGNGVYLVTRVAFTMAGKAELKITISGSRTGTIVSPTFDIPE
jgi:YtkA-like